jgi:hypothetical protein
MKVTRSAGFTDSHSSNVSSIALGIYTGYDWIFYRNSLMKFSNQHNWFHVNRSSVARERIKTALTCRRVARTDRMLRVTIDLLAYWWNCLREVEERKYQVQGESKWLGKGIDHNPLRNNDVQMKMWLSTVSYQGGLMKDMV